MPSRGRFLSPLFLSGSGAWGAPWKHTKDTCSLRALRLPSMLTVPDRSHLAPLDEGPQTPFWRAPSCPTGVPMPSLPSVLPPARTGPDAVGNSSPSWAHTTALLQPHLWHCPPPWWPSVRGCLWPRYLPIELRPCGTMLYWGGSGHPWHPPWCCGHALLVDIASPPGHKAQLETIS